MYRAERMVSPACDRRERVKNYKFHLQKLENTHSNLTKYREESPRLRQKTIEKHKRLLFEMNKNIFLGKKNIIPPSPKRSTSTRREKVTSQKTPMTARSIRPPSYWSVTQSSFPPSPKRYKDTPAKIQRQKNGTFTERFEPIAE